MSPVRIVSADELRAKVLFQDLVEPVSTAFQESSAGLADNGLIVMFPAATTDAGDVYVKTGALQGHSVYIVKISPWFAANRDAGRAQGGFLAVFDAETGHTLAILNDEHYLSDIRTAAAGALAARIFAPAQTRTVTVLGSGVQAYWQPQAVHSEQPFETLLVWARDGAKAETLAARLRPTMPNVTVQVETELEETVRRADVLITTTSSRNPLVSGEWLRSGQLVIAVGADDPLKCELDATALTRATVFVDSLEASASNGDVHHAIQQGSYTLDQVAGEIGMALAHPPTATAGSNDIIIAKLVGIGVQDLVAAETALARL